MSYGIIEYNQDGLIKCEICNKYFKRVITHVRQKHFMTEREYKLSYGFDLKKGIISKESKQKSHDAIMRNYQQCISENLNKGAKYRFKKGSKGRTKEQVSAQTKLMLIERAKNSMTEETRKKRGQEVGLSGLGNKARWHIKKQGN